MAFPFGFYRSPGAITRSLRFESLRARALDEAEPLVMQAVTRAFRPEAEALGLESRSFTEARQRIHEVERRQQSLIRGFPGDPGSPFADVIAEQRLDPTLGLSPAEVGETRVAGQADLVPRTFPGFGDEFFKGLGVERALDVVRAVEEPLASEAIKAISRSGALGGPALGPAEQLTGEPTSPIGEIDITRPPPLRAAKALLGDEEELREAEAVLAEAGLPAAVIATVITSPLNLFPGIGLTKVRTFRTLLKEASTATGAARTRAVTALRESEVFQKALRTAGSEAGGGVPPSRFRPSAPEGVRLTNDIPATTKLTDQLTKIDAQLAAGRVKGGRKALLVERAKVQAQKDIDDIVTSGRPVQEQADNVIVELEELQLELRTRAVPFRGKFRMGKKFIIEEKESRLGDPIPDRLQASASNKRLARDEAARNRFPDATAAELNAREKVFREFVDNAKFEPVEEAGRGPLRGGGRTKPTKSGLELPEGTAVHDDAENHLMILSGRQRTSFQKLGSEWREAFGQPVYEVSISRLGSGKISLPDLLKGFREMDELVRVNPSVQFIAEGRNVKVREILRRLGFERVEAPFFSRNEYFDLSKGARATPPTGPLRSGQGAPPQQPPPPRRPTATGGSPPVGGLPEQGTAGAERILATKEETLLRPGKVTQFPGIKQAASGLNPAVDTEREILVAYNARQATASTLETEFAVARQQPLEDLQNLFREQPPAYKGPKNNPFKNTLKDWGDNPEHYALTDRHRAAAATYDASSNQTLARVRGDFGVDISPFPVKAGGFYTPTVLSREALEESLEKVANGYTSASTSTKGGRAKTRIFEGAYQRWQRNPDFRAETRLEELTGLHDQGVAKMASNQTFKLGTGGLSRIEVVDLTHPSLRAAKEGAATKMTNLRRRIDTAIAQIKGTTTAGKRLDTAIRQAEKRARPILDRIDDLADEFGPELSNLSGQAREINARAEALKKIAGRVGARGEAAQLRLPELQAEVRKLEPLLEKLRRGYANANLDPYVLNQKTFQYHLAPQSTAIDSILRTRFNIGQGLTDAIDEVRLTAFAGDFSPLTIQGLLGALSHPLVAASNARNMVRVLWNPDELLRIAQREPELVERFTTATGRAFGEVGPEFVQEFKGLERLRIPFTDLRPGHAMNRRLMGAVEEMRFAAWKTDQRLLRIFNPGMSQNVADAESANFLSKMIPAINPAETARSVLRARLERIPIISTSFLISPVALTKDAASGLAKLGLSTKLSPVARWQALSGREQLAILRSINLAVIMSALTTATYVASGFTPVEAAKMALDPTGSNPRFLTIAIGKDRYIPIGGPIRSFIRGFVPEKVGTIAGVPVYVPFTNTHKWLRGKVTPAIKAPIDIARNKDFFGGKIATGSFPENILRSVWYGANSVLPLAAAAPSEALRKGTAQGVGDLAIEAGGQLLGSDIRELRLSEAFDRLPEEERGGLTYAETPSFRKREIIAANPFLKRLAEQQRAFFGGEDEGKRIRVNRSAELLPHAQSALRGGIEAIRAYNKNRSGIMGKFSGVSEEVFGDLDIEPKGRDNELLDQYYAVDFAADLNGNGIPGDDDDVRRALEQQDGLKAQLSPGVRGALNNAANFFVHPEVIEYENLRNEAKLAIRDIVDLPKWSGLTTQEGDDLDDLVARIRADVLRYKAQAVREGAEADSVTFRNTAEWLRDRGSITELDADNAMAVSSGKAIRAQERIDLALEHRDVLLRTFPDFFGNVLPVDVEREQLTQEEIEQLQPTGVR